MKKSRICYLVPGYTPTPEKEQLLKSLLVKLSESGDSIILVQHNITSPEIQNLVDYFILDKDNDLLNFYPIRGDENFIHHMYDKLYGTEIGLVVWSQYTSGAIYHGIAALSLFFRGLYFAKSIGADICHLIEYDTFIETFDEFKDNEKILTESDYSSVCYHIENDLPDMIYNQISSYNLNKYSFEDLDWSKRRSDLIKVLNKKIYGKNNSSAEVALYETLHKSKNYFSKNTANILNNNIILDLSSRIKSESVVMVPYLSNDGETVNIFVLYKTKTKDGSRQLRFTINDNDIYREVTSEFEWFLFSAGKLDEINQIDFYVDNELKHTYDFLNEIDKNHFRLNSFQSTV